MTSSSYTVYTLPVSGELFPVQIGMICAISAARKLLGTEKDSVPHIAIGSSGGNISAYIGMAGNWESQRVKNVVRTIESEAFMAEWSENIPRWMFIPFSRSLFRPGYGFKSFLLRNFTSESAITSTTEVWTGIHSSASNQHTLVCNKGSTDTLITPNSIDNLHLGTNASPIYANGDFDLISDSIMASASIPWLVKPVNINGIDYSDGGCMYSSPLTVLKNDVYSISNSGENVMKLFYMSPHSLITGASDGGSEGIFDVIEDLLYASRTVDIRAFIDLIVLLNNGVYAPPILKRQMNVDDLSSQLASLESGGTHYAVLLFPDIPCDVYSLYSNSTLKEFISIDMDNFKPAKALNIIDVIQKYIGAYIWTM